MASLVPGKSHIVWIFQKKGSEDQNVEALYPGLVSPPMDNGSLLVVDKFEI